jgi:hypothetical protein
MDIHIVRKLLLLCVALLVLLACEIPALSAPAAPDTAPLPIETIVAGTAAAAQTQTATMRPPPTQTPTATLIPTGTPTETPTATATVIFIAPTSVKPFETSSAGAQCQLVALKPNNPVLSPGEKFNVEWTLRNTSTVLWLESNIDFKFSAGKDMHKKDVYDLPTSVPTTGEVVLTVPMIAPNKPGNYTSTWVLASGKQVYCKVSISVTVK